MKRILVLSLLLLLFIPTIVYAKDSYKLTIDNSLDEYDKKNGGSRNFVTLDCFIYYSFFDAKSVTLMKDGKNYSLTVPANKYTSKSKSATATINVPKITFKGTERVEGTRHFIELDGKFGGTVTSNIVFNNAKQNYTIKVSSIDMTIYYYEEDVKNGTVEADVQMYFSYTKSEDLDNTSISSNDEKSFYIKTLTLSGLGGTKAATANTMKNTEKNTTKTAAKENVTKEVPATVSNTEETTEENNEFPIGPIAGGAGVIIAISGAGLAIKHHKGKVKTVKDSVTGEEKSYIYNDETGEYESEDGKTILNTSIEEEVERQKIKDKEFIEEQHKKMVDRETEQDRLNNEMVKEMKDGEKALEREIYIDKIGTKNGIKSSNPDDIRKGLEKVQERNIKSSEKAHQKAKNWDIAVKTAEVVEEAADITITVGETVVPGGKAVSATYKAVKSVASTAAEHGMDAGKLANATIKGLADAGTTYMSGVGKAATTVGAEIGGDVTEAVIKGKSAGEIWDAAKDASVKGVTKATVNATADALGDVVGTETANVSGYLYQKHVADPKLDEALKKNKNKPK